MPVYIRKNVSYTPPSIDAIPHEDEDDFVTDPEQIRDDLPQPFRMIDKTLRQLLDETWDIISEREDVRFAEARKVRPPQYHFALTMDGPIPGSNIAPQQTGATQQTTADDEVKPEPKPENKQSMSYATCMTDTEGRFVYIGLPNGMVALDALTQAFHGLWEEANTEISFIKSYPISPNIYVVATIDDMGIARLFAHSNNKFFLLKVMNTNPQDSDNKILVGKLELSDQADYAGMVMENPSGKEVWLEVHKLPRETWVTEIDTLVAALKKKEEKKEEVSEDSESVVDAEGEATASNPPAEPSEPSQLSASSFRSKKSHGSMFSKSQTVKKRRVSSAASFTGQRSMSFIQKLYYGRRSKKSRASSVDQGDQPPTSAEPHRDITAGEPKFSQPQLVLKVKAPPPVTANTAPSLHQAVGKIDTGDVMGTGQTPIFSQSHLDLRQMAFDHLHDDLQKYLPSDEDTDNMQYPRFHFLNGGRLIPQGLEQPSLEGRPTTVAVWKPGSSNLLQYSLLKASKDLEFKPDLVWPFTCKITATTVSPDTNVMAIGLENGNVVIWDRYMGIQRGVVTVASGKAVIQMKFLDPSLFPQDNMEYPPYPTKMGTYLLVLCANSALYTVGTGPGLVTPPSCVSPPVEKDEEFLTVIEPFMSHPDLLIAVLRDGTIQLRDCLQGNILCEIQLPNTHELTSPWEPVLSLGAQGKMLFIKGTKKEDDDGGVGAQPGAVFIFQLRSFPTLDPYFKVTRAQTPLTVHTKYQQRLDAVLAERIASQSNRKARMQERWSQFKEEIGSIHTNKEAARIKAENRPIYNFVKVQFPVYETPGSVGWSPLFAAASSPKPELEGRRG